MTINQQIAAAIDLGTNTFRLLVAAYSAEGITLLEKKLATVRLGQGLDRNHYLQTTAMEKGLEVLRTFRGLLDRYPVDSLRACGTEALRRARNSPVFLAQAREILQSGIDIVSGEEEARLSLDGALAGSTNGLAGSFLLADVGGGSTELIHADTSSGRTRIASINLGAVTLTERFLAARQYDPVMDVLLAEKIGAALEKINLPGNHREITVLGCGGTATSLAALDRNLESYDANLVHGHVLHGENLARLWNRLTAMPAAERNRIPCLGCGRGEILPAGLRVYQKLLELMQHDRMQVSDTGLLEGILLSVITAIVPAGRQPAPLKFRS